MSRPLPDLEILNDLLELKEDFTLWWKIRPEKYFEADNRITAKDKALGWNNTNAGKQAVNITNSHGYKVGKLLGKKVYAHRIIWKMVHGYDPNQIDHIDGNKLNNNISNLRDVTSLENSLNKPISSTNTSGHIGVYEVKRKKKNTYRAYIMKNNKTHYLGTFKTIEQAIEARKQAEKELGFHLNHGRLAIDKESETDKMITSSKTAEDAKR